MNPKLNKETAEKALIAFGKRIAYLRKAKGISQAELAHRCKTGVSKISDAERGRRNPTWFSLMVLARGLEITFEELTNMPEMNNFMPTIWKDDVK